MTIENLKLRDALKAAENIIVSALAHQPEDSEKCREQLQKDSIEADRLIRRAIGMPVDEDVFCSECGKKLEKVKLHMFGFNGDEYEYDGLVDFTSTLMEDGTLGICICTDTNWCGYDLSEEEQTEDISCPHCGKYPFASKHIEVEEPNQVIIGCWTKPIASKEQESTTKDTAVPDTPPRLDVCPKCGADAAVFVHPAYDGGAYVRCHECNYSDQVATWAPTDAKAAVKWNNLERN